MSNNDYLSEEEQFKEILNNEEISRIKDPEQIIQPEDKVLVKPSMLEGVDKGLSVTTHP